MQFRWSLPVALTLTTLAAHAAPQAPEPPAAATAMAAAPAVAAPTSGLFLQNFDRTVRPQDDLYRFVNGTWLKNTEIPADKSNYGAFMLLSDEAEKNLRVIVEEAAAARAASGSAQQLIGDFYSSFMDEAKIEQLGLKPLQPELDRIAAIIDRKQLLSYLSRAQLLMIDNPIGAQIFADAKNPDLNTLWVTQSGFGLPERDYYFSTDQRFTEIRGAYEKHIDNVFKLTGRKDSAAVAQDLMAFETRLAKASWPAVKLRDIEALYNPMTVESAEQATPGIDWSTWLTDMTLPGSGELVLTQKDYFQEVGKAVNDVPLATWKDYLTLRTIDAYSPYLSKAFIDENFDFYQRTLSGTPQIKPRWKRALGELEGSTGDLLGQEYVKRHFPPEAKQRMDVLVGNLLKAFDVSIDELAWMGPETKQAAHDKVRNFTVKIGYPTKWKDYTGLVVDKDNLLGNVLRARAVNVQRELK
ncbi:MAG: peptidase M13, partial [Steroidobacteraceae bacterium]|nr:peptidase M13 [Steroidobacteraceae bacterium]